MLSKTKRQRTLRGIGLSLLVTGAVAVLLGACSLWPQEAVITIDRDRRYQTIVGWEATSQAGQEFASFPEYRDELFFQAVNGLGINRIRLEIRSGIENITDFHSMYAARSLTESQFKEKRYEIVNDNDDPLTIDPAGFQFSQTDSTVESLILPMKKLLEERGEKLLINLNYVDFGASDFEHKNDPEEYAEFVLATYLHMRDKYGFVPDTVEVVLEPDTDNAEWSAKQVADAMVATAKRLRQNGFEPAFIAPSTTNAKNALDYIDVIATVPGALDPVVEFSYHRYADATDDVLKGIAERGARHGKRTSMLEWIGADQETLHKDLTLANVSAWQQYTLAFAGQDDGGAYYKVAAAAGANVVLGKRSRLLRQYFGCIRPGAVRVGASTSNESFEPVAFVSSGGPASVIVKTSSRGTAVIQGLPAGSYSVSYATHGDAVMLPDSETDAAGNLSVSIPSAGVLTVCGEPRSLLSGKQ